MVRVSVTVDQEWKPRTSRSRVLRPFFSFYGGKWRAASSRYPMPRYDTIIEPFAGSAGYATRYADRQVQLCDVDEVIVGVWEYLIRTPADEIRRLPLDVDYVDDLRHLPQEARWLIGFWLNKGTVAPSQSPSAWMRTGEWDSQFWGEVIRERIASQVDSIRHWTVQHGQYYRALNREATWFIDPPYSTPAGKHYKYNHVKYDMLGKWCQSRRGQVIVCEQSSATWLPFESIGEVKSMLGSSSEAVWCNEIL